ncbi:MAG: HEAT repeat domain-containing protein, partial [Bryobacteraceae bacterium]
SRNSRTTDSRGAAKSAGFFFPFMPPRAPCALIFLSAGLALAQAPRIGLIEFYGVREASKSDLSEAIGVKPGDPLPSSKADVEERLEAVSGVVRARVEAACCEEGQAILYVGIDEKGMHHFNYRLPPEADLDLPEEIKEKYREFLGALEEAGRAGNAAEDLTEGHSLLSDPAARAIQRQFVALAAKHENELRNVLRTAESPELRAIAAYVIGYAPKKKAIVNDLQYALQDPDDTVRSNAMRSLAALAVLERKNPEAGFRIAPTWFIEMLNSVAWTDRNNAAVALVTLTEDRDESDLSQLKDRALPALVEMAGWRHLAHALPAYILLGRIAGMPEKELQDTWSSGNREKVIERFVKK